MWSMIPQQSSATLSRAHRVDTVFVFSPRTLDSLRVHVTSGTLQVRDTVVVRETGDHLDAWATVLVTAALVAATVIASVRVERLQKRNNEVQQNHADLQREFNEMQAQQERGRRVMEDRLAKEHRMAVDAKLSGVAYALRRQLRALLEEVPEEVSAIMEIVDAWTGTSGVSAAVGEDLPGVTPGMQDIASQWARSHSGGDSINRAEQRLLELISSAPEASQDVANAIRLAFVAFYNGMSRWQGVWTIYRDREELDAQELTTGFYDIVTCTEALGEAVGEELESAEKKSRKS